MILDLASLNHVPRSLKNWQIIEINNMLHYPRICKKVHIFALKRVVIPKFYLLKRDVLIAAVRLVMGVQGPVFLCSFAVQDESKIFRSNIVVCHIVVCHLVVPVPVYFLIYIIELCILESKETEADFKCSTCTVGVWASSLCLFLYIYSQQKSYRSIGFKGCGRSNLA